MEYIAKVMSSDINLVALKVSELNRRGFGFREISHRNNFLKAPDGSSEIKPQSFVG